VRDPTDLLRAVKTYAWIWLVVGVLLVGASILILMGSRFARSVGYVAATIAALSAMAWMPYYPVWSLAYVGIAVLVFYALARYGGRQGDVA
jgi:membrane protein implicated in regulation of membrane protease activity